MFYGILIYLYYFDNKEHKAPHLHAEYAEHKAVLTIPEGELLEGKLPSKQLKLVRAWMEIHEDELLANWKLAVNGQQAFKIEPLR
jgi:hypothetical protein